MTPAQAIHKFEHLRRHTQNGERAVHKPLLALLILGRIARGQRAPVTFAEIEPKLKELLADFGRPSAVNTPHNPFWHMQSDGIWQLEGPAADSARGLAIDYCTSRQQPGRSTKDGSGKAENQESGL
jgi:putative restriction endonuclease